jgi:hypothetical protein
MGVSRLDLLRVDFNANFDISVNPDSRITEFFRTNVVVSGAADPNSFWWTARLEAKCGFWRYQRVHVIIFESGYGSLERS